MRDLQAKTPKPPAKNYDYLQKLAAEGWLHELSRVYELSVKYKLGLHRDDPNIFVSYNESGEPEIVVMGLIPVQMVAPRPNDPNAPGVTTRDLTGSVLSLPQPQAYPREVIEMPVVSPALVVDLNAPDKVIRHEFERMLKKARKRFKPPASKPGRWAMNACFDDRVFKKWRNDRIVQLADLLAWRSTLSPSEKARWSQQRLGQQLWKNRDVNDRRVSETKKNLKEALASLPALAAQIPHGKM